MRKILNRLFSLLLIFSLIFTACGEEKPDYNNTVTMLDVGQAACTLIESDGQFCLIDAGKAGGSTDIVSYLLERQVEKIDLLIISHFHYDHTSEALDIIRNFDVGTVLIPTLSDENIPDTYFYKSLEEDAKNGYFTLEYACKDMEFTIGQGVVKVLDDTYNSENINNTSTAVSYTLGDFTYVNTADSEADREQYLLEFLPENISFFTAAHHGSQDSNSQRLLDRLNPAFVGISCGRDNEYGHPHKAVLDRLADMGIPYLITCETGDIVYYIDTQTVTTE